MSNGILYDVDFWSLFSSPSRIFDLKSNIIFFFSLSVVAYQFLLVLCVCPPPDAFSSSLFKFPRIVTVFLEIFLDLSPVIMLPPWVGLAREHSESKILLVDLIPGLPGSPRYLTPLTSAVAGSYKSCSPYDNLLNVVYLLFFLSGGFIFL